MNDRQLIGIVGVYSILDCLVEKYGPLFECPNDAVAVRYFKNVVKDNVYDKGDYKLYKIGEFNPANGELQYIIPDLIVSGNDVITEVKK